MKRIFFLIAFAFSLSASAQGTAVKDTAAERKELEAQAKFYNELVEKTSIKEFQVWLYENVSAKQMNEASFQQLKTIYFQQKYYQSLQAKEQPKK
jgi:hypothetical protein